MSNEDKRYSELYNAAEKNDVDALYEIICNDTYTYDYYNQKECDGSTALHKAVEKENFYFVEFLLQKGVHLNVRDKLNRTPYDIAYTMNNSALLELLRRPRNSEYYTSNPFASYSFQSTYTRKPIHLAHPGHPLQNCPESVHSDPYGHIRKLASKSLTNSSQYAKIQDLINEADGFNYPVALIQAYTIESPFYETINNTLNEWQLHKDNDADVLSYWKEVRDYMFRIQDNFDLFGTSCYRGLTLKNERELDVYQPLAEFAFPQFTSTSKSKTTALGFTIPKKDAKIPVLMEIRITGQYHQIDISDISEYREEAEVLWPPWSTFRVLNVNRNYTDPETTKRYTYILLEPIHPSYDRQ
ncbi:unnamed protein product [Didymodactylos carnosus]|uniref:NAD(P)(+)--arginine ADP-ribosyltransferase n=1 Tax=Didymodactylos carnosus TaxID=1234261 RepID=A0A813TJR6_9BILA|nr:unnamed protein product [Didymodactylos carnosus]CAF1054318.1 unnamed protein product [Didymodactylos carnosus]CAF3599496.1 unnamed protein product [Didymodactylos carnosus]CAF3820677.1 unnamed protein product [Didymodactylos carnosus]